MIRRLIPYLALLGAGVVTFLLTYFWAGWHWPLWAMILGWAFIATLLIYGAVIWDRVDARRAREGQK